ncbi:hypothetical protein L7F22_030435 [Adiantum nelumboides]|nr:hypothetical protein [Adiantum nelumboides]
MNSLDYKQSNEDPRLYVKKQSNEELIMLTLYVDDMLIASHSKKDIADLKTKLKSKFDMKDLGEANHILGMRITRDRKKRFLYLPQKEHVHKFLDRFTNMQKGKALSTPLPANLKLSKNACPKSVEEKAEMAKIPYASAYGSLMYTMVATRRSYPLSELCVYYSLSLTLLALYPCIAFRASPPSVSIHTWT